MASFQLPLITEESCLHLNEVSIWFFITTTLNLCSFSWNFRAFYSHFVISPSFPIVFFILRCYFFPPCLSSLTPPWLWAKVTPGGGGQFSNPWWTKWSFQSVASPQRGLAKKLLIASLLPLKGWWTHAVLAEVLLAFIRGHNFFLLLWTGNLFQSPWSFPCLLLGYF